MVDATEGYRPGTKPLAAIAMLVCGLRVRRDVASAMAKAGFTLLGRRGLVEMHGGEYRPRGRFWDVAENCGATADGRATEWATGQSARHTVRST